MLRRLLLLTASTLAACAAPPLYSVFPPAVPGSEAQRVERGTFSIVPPVGWEVQDADAATSLRAREVPPPDGQHRLFRILTVEPAAAARGDEPEAIAAAALAALRARHATDDLEVREHGAVRLGDRDCVYQVGRMRGPAAEWWFEVLEYHVPGAESSLVVSFLVPDGQLALSRKALAETAATLRTQLRAPVALGGEMVWLDDHHLGLVLPGDWRAADATGGPLAVFTRDGGEAQCDIVAETRDQGFDLDRLLAGYEADHANRAGFTLLGTQRRQVGERPAVRFLAAYRDEAGTVVVDDLFVAQGNKLYRVQFRVPQDEFAAVRKAIERAVGSVRIE